MGRKTPRLISKWVGKEVYEVKEIPTGKLWGILRKAWKAFRIAKAQKDKKEMDYWMTVINNVKKELKRRGEL